MSPSSSPRVLMACDWLLKYAAGLAGGIAEAGAEVAVLTRDHGLEFGGSPAAMREAVGELTGPSVPLWTLPGRVRDPGAIRALGRLVRTRRRFAPDVLHLQAGIENDARLFVAAGARPGRYALTLHDPTGHPGEEQLSRAIEVMANRMLRHAGLVFVHAESLRQELLEHRDVTGPVVVVPHGTPAPTVAPLPDRPAILLFGRLTPYKGLAVLLDAMDAVWAALPETRLVVAGEGEAPAHPALGDERVVARLEHIPERDVPGLFAAASVVALPYTQASQSGVGSLAKSHGRPLVVTRSGGLPELVADGSGVVVPPSDAAALADALLDILRSPDRAQEMGRRGAQAASAASSWARVGALTLAAYEEHGLLVRHEHHHRGGARRR